MTQTVTQIPGYIAGTWNIDAVHSELGFWVRYMMVSKVGGTFNTFSGQLVTAEDFSQSTATATIDLSSIDTNNEQRDNHIRSADFFDVEKHPEMTYRSTAIRQDDGEYILDGELTLRGITKNVPLTLEVNGFAPAAQGPARAGFSATGQFNRSDFGVSFGLGEGGGSIVSDKVTLHLEIAAVLAEDA